MEDGGPVGPALEGDLLTIANFLALIIGLIIWFLIIYLAGGWD